MPKSEIGEFIFPAHLIENSICDTMSIGFLDVDTLVTIYRRFRILCIQ